MPGPTYCKGTRTCIIPPPLTFGSRPFPAPAPNLNLRSISVVTRILHESQVWAKNLEMARSSGPLPRHLFSLPPQFAPHLPIEPGATRRLPFAAAPSAIAGLPQRVSGSAQQVGRSAGRASEAVRLSQGSGGRALALPPAPRRL